MLFNTTFNNISAISCKKPECPEKTTDLPQVTDNFIIEWVYTYIKYLHTDLRPEYGPIKLV
jgi:hypothetical protein